jgi:cell division protein FtsB
MADHTLFKKNESPEEPLPMRERVLDWAQHAWRPAGTMVAVALALAFGWGVIHGKHGLSVWHQQRTEDKQLRQEIQDLEQENARLRNHVERLKSDPNAIEHEAREKLHYAKPGEVIYTLPAQPKAQRVEGGK